MSQFDVYENANPATRELYPYLVNIQSDVLSGLGTRIVLPLTRDRRFIENSMQRLTPQVDYNGETLTIMTPQMAAIAEKALHKPVGTLEHFRTEIVAAVDFALGGV